MKNLCSIGVRGGSKGVKNKNLKLMNDKPLLAYTIEQAKESGLFEHIVLSTDSEEIQELALSLGADERILPSIAVIWLAPVNVKSSPPLFSFPTIFAVTA